ncbi:MAG: hypothetical protein C0504_10360 [Candidatus Solibacter sp.]|nr:hypothetical protein [Candidatus Solibacter sp.]
MRKATVCFIAAILAVPAVAQVQPAPPGTAPIDGLSLRNHRWPRSTNLKQWTADVLRISGTDKQNETAQGKAFFEWLRLFSRMAVGGMIQSFEGPYGKETPVLDAHKQLFVYGWGFCDTSSRIAEAAWKEYKSDPKSAERVITQHADLGYHTMYRLRMDGRYGAFDPRYGYYLIERDAPDARILDWREVNGRFEINKTYKNRSKPYFEIYGREWNSALLIQPGWFDSEAAYRAAGSPIETVFGDSHYQMGTAFHDMGFTMKRGTTITRYWDNSARKFYVPAGKHTQRELPFLASGRFYRVTDKSHGGNWPAHDPNYLRAKPYLATIPTNEGYPADLAGGQSIGQAYGAIDYRPNLAGKAYLDAISPGATLVHSTAAPHLRPAQITAGGEAVIDIRSPFVLVDGTLSAELIGNAEIEIRTLAPKTRAANQPDQWSGWQPLLSGPGPKAAELGRPRFNGKDPSIHGLYHFQLRLRVNPDPARKAPAGLKFIALKLYFENGIMSIPPLFDGSNTLSLRTAAAPAAPVTISYRYQTAQGERQAAHTLPPSALSKGEASFTLQAPGLTRCQSVSISY